jgi:hypothetical protein
MLLRWVAASLALIGAQASAGAAAAGEPVAPWKIEYGTSGGITGDTEAVRLEDSGRVIFETSDGTRSDQMASPEQLAKLMAILRRLELSGAPRPLPRERPRPDARYTFLTITVADRVYRMDLKTRNAAIDELFSIVGPLFQEGLRQAKKVPFDLGRIWKVTEGAWDRSVGGANADWEGVWTRRGSSNVFDGFWVNRKTKESVRDVLEVESADQNDVSVYRQGMKQRYHGTYAPLHPENVRGRGEWFRPGDYWDAIIER